MDSFWPDWHNGFVSEQPDGDSSLVGPPSEFAHLVRDALSHLYSPAHLARHSLHAYLRLSLPTTGSPAQALRDLLIDAIESLEPPQGHGRGDKDYRPYLILVQRYIVGASEEEAATKLHVSERQVRRETQMGLQALTAYLWARGEGASPDPAAGGLRAEMEALGLHLEPTTGAAMLASLEAAAVSLGQQYGALFSVASTKRSISFLCDRTYARQAVLSALGALFARRLSAVEAGAMEGAGRSVLRLAALPPLTGAAAEDLGADLATARSLMEAQHGEVEMLRGQEGLLLGVGFVFQSLEAAHVLVVDDNATMLQLYRRYLASGNYRVSLTGSAQEAEELLTSTTPDAIVMDVMMRDVDGWELLQRLRSRPELRSVPILVCSVLDEPKLAQALGAQGYVKKPVGATDLLQALESVLTPPGAAAPAARSWARSQPGSS